MFFILVSGFSRDCATKQKSEILHYIVAQKYCKFKQRKKNVILVQNDKVYSCFIAKL